MNVEKWGEEFGIEDVMKDCFCLSCYGILWMELGMFVFEEGNLCELCYGVVGGVDGWYEVYGDYGFFFEIMDDLIVFCKENKEDFEYCWVCFEICFKVGMNILNDVMVIVKNCFECYVVLIVELVEVGYLFSDKFEFVEWV